MLYRKRVSLWTVEFLVAIHQVLFVPEVTIAACDQFLCGMFSRLESYCIARMPTLWPVLPFLFEHTVALHLTSILMRMRLVVSHHLVDSVVVQLLSHARMHLQRVLSLGLHGKDPVPVLMSYFLSAPQNTFAVHVPIFSRSSCLVDLALAL